MSGRESLFSPPTRWEQLTPEQQDRVKHLLMPDADDNLDDVIARCERALQILRGEKP